MTATAPVKETAMDVRTATPVEIDTELARITGEHARVEARLAGMRKHLEHLEKQTGFYRSELQIERAQEEIGTLEGQADDLRRQAKPLQDEYLRRGRWTRAFLVTNANGHVHNTTACSTCFPTTEFAWLPEFSGHDEAEVVQAAGEKACTVCFPSAPVDVLRRKSTIELPERRAARLERERKAAERAAKKAATGITNPDGTTLRGRHNWEIKTERTAWIEVVDNIVSARYYKYSAQDEANARIIAALVHKTGTTEDEVMAEIEKKVVAKAKREGVYR
jgi:hypothetical protein